MADQQMTAIWPAPPPFYKNFTKANTARLHRARKEAGIPSSNSATSIITSTLDHNDNEAATSSTLNRATLDITTLPPEIRYLLPPPPPPADKYRSFGSSIDLDAPPMSLASAGVEQLFPDSDSVSKNPQPYLLALSRSLITKFLELTGVLSLDPTKGLERTQDLRTMMNNMHFLINQYRPHQARETMILVFEERIARLRAETEKIQAARKKVEEVLEGMGRIGGEESRDSESMDIDGGEQIAPQDDEKSAGQEAKSANALKIKVTQRAAWAVLNRLDQSLDVAG